MVAAIEGSSMPRANRPNPRQARMHNVPVETTTHP
jgi:hypothetical protein